jgi:hypothetical protein
MMMKPKYRYVKLTLILDEDRCIMERGVQFAHTDEYGMTDIVGGKAMSIYARVREDRIINISEDDPVYGFSEEHELAMKLGDGGVKEGK